MHTLKMRVSCCLMLASVITFTGCMQQHAQSANSSNRVFGYSSLKSNDIGFVIDAKNHQITVGDTGVPARFCDKESNYICVDSKVFYFAIPRKAERERTSWEEAGHKYTVETPLHRVKLLGGEINIEIISTIGPKDVDKPASVNYFVYSPELGLLAVESWTPGDAHMTLFVSNDPLGFGADNVFATR